MDTLLVANRGEIAVRVMRSAKALGLRTVAVYSDADRRAPHVRAADAAVWIGPTLATESYLNIGALLDAARRTGADAVHPGYGFLSERAAFAHAVRDAGLTFVGPTPEVIELMGRKDRAREVAVAAGVPVIPRVEVGSSGRKGGSAGFPVLVKAAAGGGGKGMRIVRAPADLAPALAAARSEAGAAFGDDTMLLERYVERGRHVEVQVLADEHGHVVHLFERDCSSQRRHQKVLEEAPAPTISPATRQVLLDSAVALSREVGYTNAGTVEFLVAAEHDQEEVYFLEMNTRLQVEHPVTEGVVRVAGRPLDLVELQLRIAAGEPLPFGQRDVTCQGHAIEARVYAEDAFGGFLPQAGRAELVRWPPPGPGQARVDAALETGAEVGTAYDPMLGKVIVTGRDRETARRGLVAALDDSAILGLTTNLGFLRALAASDAFGQHQVHTSWLDQHANELRPPDADAAALVAAWALGHSVTGARAADPFAVADGWRVSGPPAPTCVELVVEGQERRYAVGRDTVDAPSGGHGVHQVAAEDGLLVLEVDGAVRRAAVLIQPQQVQVAYQGHRFTFGRPGASGPSTAGAITDGAVIAPMPGTVLRVAVAEGDAVDRGQLLGVLEAMKMELTLTAPVAGTVRDVLVASGEQVGLGATLFVVIQEEP